MRLIANRIAVVAATSAALLTLPVNAHAILQLGASIDGGGTITAIDNDLTNTCGPPPIIGPCQLPDINPTLGTLTIGNTTAAGGDLDIQTSVHTQNVSGGPGLMNRLDSTGTQFTNLSSTSSHTFSVAIGATDFLGPSVTASDTGAGQWSTLGGPFGASQISMRWFDDPNNGQGGITPSSVQPGNLLEIFNDVAGPNNPDSFSHNGGPYAGTDPLRFSMTLQFDGTIGPGVRLTGREQTEIKPTAVPGPSTLLLLGSALGLFGWWRFKP
jgi:hypothetical protein